MSLTKFIQEHTLLKNADKLIYYGGSFNPWHAGHSSCLELAKDKAPVIVMPDNNPQKEDLYHRTSPKDLEDKIKALNTKALIFDEYFFLNEKTPTNEWVTELIQNFPQKEHYLLLGHDSFIGLDTWINFESILKNLTGIYVVARQDDHEKNEQKTELYKSINSNLNIEFLGNHPFEHISSTELRLKN